MHPRVVIEEHEMPPELGRLFKQARRNLLWFSENAERLDVFNSYDYPNWSVALLAPPHYYEIKRS